MIPPTLTGRDTRKKREEILNYFNDSYETFEKLFDMLKDDSVFYKKSEPTRPSHDILLWAYGYILL